MRVSSGLILVAALLFTLAASPPPSLAKDEEPTCQKTTEIALKPFIAALEAAKKGQEKHAEETAAKLKRQQEYIAALRATRKTFDEKRIADLKAHDNRIAWAQETIEAIRKSYNDEIRKLTEALRKAAAAKNQREIARLNKIIVAKRTEFVADKRSGYSSKFGRSRTTNGWKVFITEERKRRADSVAAHAAGKVGIYFGFLGSSQTWQRVQKLIAEETERMAATRARKDAFYMPTLGRSMTGEKIDLLVREREEALADARARIAAGTFTLYVSTFGRSVDRNYALAEMAKAKASLENVRKGWGDGSYRHYNPRAGRSISTGEIREMIAKAEKTLADFIAAGPDGIVYVPSAGRTISGTEILDRIRTAKTDKARQHWQKVFADWKTARTKEIERLRKIVEGHKATLEKHREIWLADIKKREEDIAGRLTRGLAQTPCGGGTPDRALVDRHTALLGSLSETEKERTCREARYGDRVFLTPSGEMHGAPRDAILAALSDTDLRDGTPQPPAPGLSVDELVLTLKNGLDYLAGHADTGNNIAGFNISKTRAAVARLEDQMARLAQTSKGKGKAFDRAQRLLAETLAGTIDELKAANNFFNSADFAAVEQAILGGGGRSALRNSDGARRALRQIAEMRQAAGALDGVALPRLARGVDALGRIGADQLNAARNMVNRAVSVSEVRGVWSGMSGLEKKLFLANLAATAAEMKNRIDKGEPAMEAGFRSGTNLVIDLVIGGIPITAAAEAVSQVLFVSGEWFGGQEGMSEGTLSNVSKTLAQGALDKVAQGSSALGTAFWTYVDDIKPDSELLANVNTSRLEMSIEKAEAELATAKRGSLEAARLMRIRARLRQLLRAKSGQKC